MLLWSLVLAGISSVGASSVFGAERAGSLTLNNADVRIVFQALAKETDLSCLIRDDVEARITGEFNLPSPEVFEKLAEAAGCRALVTNQFCLVYSKNWKPSDDLMNTLVGLVRKSTALSRKKQQVFWVDRGDISTAIEVLFHETNMKVKSRPTRAGTARFVGLSRVVAVKVLLESVDCSLIRSNDTWEVMLREPKPAK